MQYTGAIHLYGYSWLCVGSLCHFSNHSTPSCTPQDCSENVSCCGFRRWYALHMFVESFQGQYKDGTDGSQDFRMVSASFLILRILILFSFLVRYHQHTWTSSKLKKTSIWIFVAVSCLYAFMRPYKQNFRNNVDIFMLGLLAILSLTFLTETNYPGSNSSTSSLLLINHTAVKCSTHGTDILHLLRAIKESRHNTVAHKELQNIEKMHAGYQSTGGRCGG